MWQSAAVFCLVHANRRLSNYEEDSRSTAVSRESTTFCCTLILTSCHQNLCHCRIFRVLCCTLSYFLLLWLSMLFYTAACSSSCIGFILLLMDFKNPIWVTQCVSLYLCKFALGSSLSPAVKTVLWDNHAYSKSRKRCVPLELHNTHCCIL